MTKRNKISSKKSRGSIKIDLSDMESEPKPDDRIHIDFDRSNSVIDINFIEPSMVLLSKANLPTKTKPKKIYTNEEIDKALKNYIYLEKGQIDNVPTGVHIRYITINDDGSPKFCIGGLLASKHDNYVILKSGKDLDGKPIIWSVQKSKQIKLGVNKGKFIDTQFYKKMNDIDQKCIDLQKELKSFKKNIKKKVVKKKLSKKKKVIKKSI